MTAIGWLQIVVFLGAVLLLTKPLGLYLARVFERRRTWLDPLARPVERLLYRLTRVDEKHEMEWTEYGAAMLLFSLVSFLVLYAILRLQAWQPWGNPQALGRSVAFAFEGFVHADVLRRWGFQLLQDRRHVAAGEDVARQQQDGQPVDGGHGRAGDHVGGAGPDGRGADVGGQAQAALGKRGGDVHRALLVAAEAIGQIGVLLQCLADAGAPAGTRP